RLYGPEEGRWTAEELEETQNAQPALFVVSYALAELWRSWGLEPWAMLGHSVGEYVAATLAGVLEPEAALELVQTRATLMGRLPRGAMLSVELPAAEAEAWAGDGVSLAAENGPRLSVLSGPLPAIERVEAALEAQGVSCRRLATSHAFHSAMMEPILEAFGAAVSRVKLSPPRRRYLSGLTGTWIKAEEATDPGYWVRHLRERVRFSAALGELLGRGRMACVEVGPGRALSSLVRSHPSKSADTWAFGSLPPSGSEEAEGAFVLRSLGRYWLAGGEVSWERFFGNESRRREPLPPYPFERRRYWLEMPARAVAQAPREEDARPPAIEASPERSNRPHLPSTYVAPETDTERALVRIWEDLLHIAPIGVDDDFFELGGHSLLGTQVMSRAGSAFGRQVPLGFLFEAPTVARLAARLAEGGGGSMEPEAPPLEVTERPEALPLSFAQQRLWFLDRLAPGGAVHNIYLRVRFEGDCDPAALARALTELVRRHEALRTTFAIEGWSPVQRIAPPAPFSLPAVDLADLPVKERAAAVDRRVAEHKAEPFDLEKGPLFTARLLRLAEREHQLLLHLHHIIADGWSVGVITRELAALYAAFSQGRPSPLPELPLQYADYALWQRRWLQGERVERELDYWRRQLAGLSPQQDLPLPAPRPPDPAFRAGEAALTLPEGLSASLRSLSHEAGASLFMTLLAGFKALLLRYLGQEDLCVGSPVAGRSRPELEGLVGLFLNNLALRTSLGGDPPFRELLERVRGTALEALAHQHVPFERLLEELAPERDLSRTPLFRVFFNMLNLPLQEVRLPGLRLEAVSSPVRVSMFDLTLYVAETEGRLRTLWVYNAGLLEAAQIERMAEHFRALLEGVAADPDRRLLDLPLLSAAERQQAVRPLPPLPPAAGSIGERFREAAARFPGRPAVADPVRGFRSYREIEEMAERVGRALLSLGGRPGERVGLLFDPGPEMVAGLLGTLFSGQAYVALDPRYPRERLELLLADSGASALVAGERYAALAEGLAAGRPVVVPEREPQATERTAWPQVPAGALAYILYTSGSTGLPKGVMQSHGNVLRHIENYADGLDLGPEDRLSLLSSYAFDGAVMDIFGALLSGAALCPLDLRSGAPDLAGWVRDTRITVYHSTPTVYRLFVEGLRPGEVLPDLRRVVLGGEEAKRGDFEAFRRFAPPGAVFVNGLGPSESTLALQIHLTRRSGLSRGAVPAGRPVAGLGVRLVHAGGEQVAVYGTGEIVLEGPQIALGYWRRPEATAAAFAPGASGRAYRTGDLGRLLPDGTIEFAGRVDQQVKIRGHRVEPGEVEACLLALPEVAEAAVVPFDEPGGGRALAAYAVPAAGARIRPEALRDALRGRLQEFLVPASFHVLAALPRTPNGKLDRRALPEPAALRRSGPEGPRVAPRTRKELRLAEIWTRLLGVPEVGVHDDFFALGGHSLLLLQMAGQVREAFGVDLPLAAVYRSPTIADLTEIIVRSQRYPLLEEGVRLAAAAGGAGSRLVSLRPEGTLPPLFCVHAVGGHLLDFHDLVRELGPDQPVFGLQSRGFESDEEPLTTIEEMAAAYLEAVRAASPRGPYRIAGYCVGGLVAYEMARQLRAAGEGVELLAVLDARADRRRRAELGDAMIEGFAAYSFAVELNLRIAPERFEEAGPERFPDLIWEELCRSSEETARQLGDRTFRRLYRVFVANRRASWTYRPGPYDGGLVLFEPQHSTYPAETRASALGWRELCAGPVEHAVVPGGHVTMMREPQVAALARRLRATAAPVRTAAAIPFTTTQGDGE
ncbi:MAG TPA: amino acid adenylation domain-containing protein, partial [Thermoanaerobaculia bacterium]|nr:amino acid adenylation domain-containing protein [Thermoanaerobaculia bacterium]